MHHADFDGRNAQRRSRRVPNWRWHVLTTPLPPVRLTTLIGCPSVFQQAADDARRGVGPAAGAPWDDHRDGALGISRQGEDGPIASRPPTAVRARAQVRMNVLLFMVSSLFFVFLIYASAQFPRQHQPLLHDHAFQEPAAE